MLNFKKTVLVIASLALVGGFVGCKKKDAGGEGGVALAAAASWEKSDVNNLLSYVPADASAVYASTHNFDLKNPALKSIVDKGVEALNNSVKKLDEEIAKKSGDEAAQLKSIRDQLADSVTAAKDPTLWGLSADGRDDTVAYIQGNNAVAHVHVVDHTKFQAKFDALIKGVSAGNKGVVVETKNVGEGDAAWVVYSIKDAAASGVQPALAVHYAAPVTSITIVDANTVNAAALDALAKPAATPISKDALGKVADDAFAVGYTDNVKLIALVKDPTITKLLNAASGESIPVECIDESADLVTLFPRTNFMQRIIKDGQMTIDASYVISDKAELAKIKALTVDSPEIISDSSVAGLKLNLNLDKTIDYLTEISGKLSAKTFKCDIYAEVAKSAKDLPTLIASPEIASMRKLVAGVSGINVVVNSVDLKNMKFDAAIDVTGPKIGETVPAVLEMLKGMSPDMVSLFPIKKDEATTIDLQPLLEMPISVSTTYTDNDLIVVTTPNDALKFSKTKKSNNNNFFELKIDTSVLEAIAEEDLPLSIVYSTSFGVNNEGISSSAVIKF